jgi:hypothetical protein
MGYYSFKSWVFSSIPLSGKKGYRVLLKGVPATTDRAHMTVMLVQAFKVDRELQ